VRTPNELRTIDGQDTVATEYEYDGESIIAVDFGRVHGDLTVDIVDDTAIVIANSDQFEFELPNEASEVTANNGVLTIEG
jgi:hypothetical protein